MLPRQRSREEGDRAGGEREKESFGSTLVTTAIALTRSHHGAFLDRVPICNGATNASLLHQSVLTGRRARGGKEFRSFYSRLSTPFRPAHRKPPTRAGFPREAEDAGKSATV